MKCFHYFKDKFRSKEQRSFKPLCSAASPHSISDLDEAKALNLRIFSFSELRKATRNFNPELWIGEGGFGSVYKGKIKPANGKGEPLVVAIKKLNMDGFQGHTEWLAELKFLGVLEHPNVIKLIGLCTVDGEKGFQRLLVYEFMQNKSLQDHLFTQAFPPLPWKTRLQIILGAARALAYLHDTCFRTLGWQGRGQWQGMSMFQHELWGLTAMLPRNTWRPDIYHIRVKYGVLVWCYTRFFPASGPSSEQSLLQWVKQFPADGERFGSIMDPGLGNQYTIGAAREIAKLADACLSTSPKERPKMSEVVERLEHIIQISEEGNADASETIEPAEN